MKERLLVEILIHSLLRETKRFSNLSKTGEKMSNVSDRSRLVAFLLCWFLGYLGIHRFYVGKTGTGILYLLTVGIFGIGIFVDWIVILVGGFKDDQGRTLTNW